MDLDAFYLERFFARHEFSARYLFSSSDCESIAIKDLLALEPAAREAFEALWLGYTETTGSPYLRREISTLYHRIDEGDVVVHAGAQEAIFLAMRAILHPGDHVIVHFPSYPSLSSVPKALGCEVTPWVTSYDEKWKLDLNFLRRRMKSNTRLVIVNCPHNPTGYQIEKDEYRELLKIVSDHGAILFSDEVYRGLEYDVADRLPAAADVSETAVSLGVMSKSFGLAGLRIGWIATRNEGIRRRIAELKDYTTICNSAPSEFLAALAIRNREVLWARNLTLIHRNLALLRVFFEHYSDEMEWVEPNAGCIGFPKLKRELGATQFSEQVLAATGVLLVPGNLFGFDDRHFRIGFGRENMPEALSYVESFLLRR